MYIQMLKATDFEASPMRLDSVCINRGMEDVGNPAGFFTDKGMFIYYRRGGMGRKVGGLTKNIEGREGGV